MKVTTESLILISAIVYTILITGCFIFALVEKIGLWGIFSKMDKPEWKSIIPLYNQVVLLKELKLSPYLIFLYIDYLIPIIGYFAGRDVKWAFILVTIGFLIYKFILSVRLGEAFKKGGVFSFFLAFFPSILYPVLGCSKKEEYHEIKIVSKKSKNK